jgi:hypothetical protein
MVHHSCPKCGCGKKAHATTVKHKCKMCGSGWFDDMTNFGKQAVSAVQSVASNPLAQAAFNMAAPAAMNLANQYAPGAVSAAKRGMNLANMAQQAYSNPAAAAMQLANQYAPGAMNAAQSAMSNPYAQAAMSNPMVQAGMSAVRKRVGLGRNCGGVQLRDPTYGEVAHAQMRAAGRKRRGGKKKGASPMDMASQVLGAIPGAAEALGPFGALLGLEAPPPPPPHATFSAVRQGPMVAARPRTLGRAMPPPIPVAMSRAERDARTKAIMRQGVNNDYNSAKYAKRGGFNLMKAANKAFSIGKSIASNPMVQQFASMAAPAAMRLANQYAPGAVSAVNRGMQMAQNVASNPYAQAAMANPYAQAGMSAVRKRVGLGRRTRPPTAHSQAVGKVMRESGMSLPEASRYVKQNGLAY